MRGGISLDSAAGQFDVRHAIEQRLDGYLTLHAGQSRAQTIMDSLGEGQVPVVGPRYIQAVGVLKLLGSRLADP